MLRDVGYVLKKLDWMRVERIWPNGLRYLWTDAFGVVLYVSLYRELGESRWLGRAARGRRVPRAWPSAWPSYRRG
jgi:hypothetical protein